MITGGSQQDPEWIACHGEGWITDPRSVNVQSNVINGWRKRVEAVGGPDKPAVQSLYMDLLEDPDAPPQTIHLGIRSGVNNLREHLESLQDIGINHVTLNLRFKHIDIETTLKRLANELLPDFTD